jgi:plastocyanin
MKKRTILTIGLALTLTLAACQNGGGDLSADDAVASTDVSVVDNRFEPAVIEVGVGETVTWTWDGNAPHDVDGEGFASEVQDSGTFEHTFDTAGEYEYVCNIHGGMNGLVVVTDR